MVSVQYKCCTFHINLLEIILSTLLSNLSEGGGGDFNRRERTWGLGRGCGAMIR